MKYEGTWQTWKDRAEKAEAARDALAAALISLCHPLGHSQDWPPFSRKLQDAEAILDQFAPGWSSKKS